MSVEGLTGATQIPMLGRPSWSSAALRELWLICRAGGLALPGRTDLEGSAWSAFRVLVRILTRCLAVAAEWWCGVVVGPRDLDELYHPGGELRKPTPARLNSP